MPSTRLDSTRLDSPFPVEHVSFSVVAAMLLPYDDSPLPVSAVFSLVRVGRLVMPHDIHIYIFVYEWCPLVDDSLQTVWS